MGSRAKTLLQIRSAAHILPALAAIITGHPRYEPVIRWNSETISFNAFRLFELLFWRRVGIRAEASSGDIIDENGAAHHVMVCYSWEATIVYAEVLFRAKVREWMRRIRAIKIPSLHDIIAPVPRFAFEGISYIPRTTSQRSGYLFSIAFDATSANVDGSPTATRSHTVTGTDPFLMGTSVGVVGSQNVSACTWNGSESMSEVVTSGVVCPSDRCIDFWYRTAPTTGTHNLVTTATGGYSGMNAASYSGVKQTSPIDSNNGGNTASSVTSFTSTTTVVSSGCWLVWSTKVSSSAPSAGTGTTKRQQDQGIWDSNGTVSTGSQSLNITSISQNFAGILASILPSVVSSPSRGFLVMMEKA